MLELAEQMQALGVTYRNRVRFAFWGAEESGLIGSTEYVLTLSDAEFEKIGAEPELRHARVAELRDG